MTYQSMAALSFDAAFRDRTITCAKEQALIFKDDGRPDMAALADSIIESPSNAHGLFELVCVAPGFTDIDDSSTITDGDILAAVQAQWPTYAGVMFPADTPPAE